MAKGLKRGLKGRKKKAKKTASGLTRGQWRACAGVNSQTGRIKKGYKSKKKGCPTKAKKR